MPHDTDLPPKREWRDHPAYARWFWYVVGALLAALAAGPAVRGFLWLFDLSWGWV